RSPLAHEGLGRPRIPVEAGELHAPAQRARRARGSSELAAPKKKNFRGAPISGSGGDKPWLDDRAPRKRNRQTENRKLRQQHRRAVAILQFNAARRSPALRNSPPSAEITISTRRFCCIPAAVSLLATG